MANHRSAAKRIRSDKAKKTLNHYQARTTRNAVKKIRSLAEAEEIGKQSPKVISMIDKLAKKGVIHKNKAANLKSKLMKKAGKKTAPEAGPAAAKAAK
ncbi:MAG TPA: 30S ribosomal protein S20 [Bacteroidales bacterium]|nr:30S ribosomal protein S20 [Bacteroidales bacterium]